MRTGQHGSRHGRQGQMPQRLEGQDGGAGKRRQQRRRDPPRRGRHRENRRGQQRQVRHALGLRYVNRLPFHDVRPGDRGRLPEEGEQSRAVGVERRREQRGQRRQGDGENSGRHAHASVGHGARILNRRAADRGDARGGPDGQQPKAGQEGPVKVGPNGDDRRGQPQGADSPAVGGIDDEQQQEEEEIGEQLRADRAIAHFHDEHDEEDDDARGHGPRADGAEMAVQQEDDAEEDRRFQGEQAARAGGVERCREDRLAGPLVVDPRLARGKVRIGVGRGQTAAGEHVLSKPHVAPEVGIGDRARADIEADGDNQQQHGGALAAVRVVKRTHGIFLVRNIPSQG